MSFYTSLWIPGGLEFGDWEKCVAVPLTVSVGNVIEDSNDVFINIISNRFIRDSQK